MSRSELGLKRSGRDYVSVAIKADLLNRITRFVDSSDEAHAAGCPGANSLLAEELKSKLLLSPKMNTPS
jgi:hypothetical protein